MAFKISNEVRTAILGILAIVLFVFGFNYLKGSSLLSSSKTMYAIYDEANGLTPSSFVMIKGVNIGSVQDIALSKKYPGKVEVKFTVSKDAQFPEDSRVQISNVDLFTPKCLAIIPGTGTKQAADGAVLQTQKENGLMDKLGGVGDKIDPLVANIDGTISGAKGAISTIDNTVANINSLIDAKTKANLQQSIAGLDASVKDFNLLSAELAAQRSKISSTVSSLEAFAKNLNTNNQSINSTLNNVKNITDNVNKTSENLAKADINQTVTNLKNTLGELDRTLAKINNNEGTVGMLVNDKKLYNDLQGTMNSLDALLADMKANPSRYVSFSLIGRKQKAATPTP
jgi:phospholipid/cholesterol/gamma-HCH transport system substrate-binding protein